MLVPIALKFTNVLLLLLKQFVHFDVILGQDGTSSLVVLLVSQLLYLRLGFLSVCQNQTIDYFLPSFAAYLEVCLP